MGEQLSAESLASCPVRHSKEFQIVTEQEFLTNDRDAGHAAVLFRDKAVTPLWEWCEIAVPIFGLVAQTFPRIGVC